MLFPVFRVHLSTGHLLSIFGTSVLICKRYQRSDPNQILRSQSKLTSDHVHARAVASLPHSLRVELLKNSFRTVIENHNGTYSEVLAQPMLFSSHNLSFRCLFSFVRCPVRNCNYQKGEEDMTIKISEEGGGIPHRNIKDVFHVLFHHRPRPIPTWYDPLLLCPTGLFILFRLLKAPSSTIGTTDDIHVPGDSAMTDMNHAPLAGLGYGLPVSRLYARYFGGDLDLISIEVRLSSPFLLMFSCFFHPSIPLSSTGEY